MIRRSLMLCALLVASGGVTPARAQAMPTLAVDLRDVARAIVHVHETLPVQSGALTLVFPKWIPGTHAASGPIADLVNLRINAGSQTVAWQRDLVDAYAFHIEVPQGASTLDLLFDTVYAPGTKTTGHIAFLDWNEVVLYPQGTDVRTWQIEPSVALPAGWSAASSLGAPPYAARSLEMLVDAPLLASDHLTMFSIAQGDGPVSMAIASDLAQPSVDPKVIDHFRGVVAQARALFGGYHWRTYTFLVTLSDAIGYAGLEHHESSWNGVPQNGLSSEDRAKAYAGYLLAHEFTHSWNGKYRRPDGITKSDFQAPYTTDLLWMYEGLTAYYGDVLATRGGFWNRDEFVLQLATKAASLEIEPGRRTRALVDTARAEAITRPAPAAWSAQRRGVEYYFEGELIWLEADTLIRMHSGGTRSLDDVAKAFFGGTAAPSVVPYNRDDIVAALNAVDPFDWSTFLADRIDRIAPHAPVGGFANAGWRIVYDDTQTAAATLAPRRSSGLDARQSLGLAVGGGGVISDVLQGSPAAAVGIGPGTRIVAVAGRAYGDDVLAEAIRSATSDAPIVLILEAPGGRFSTQALTYSGGRRIPHAERLVGQPDLMTQITRPRGDAP